MSNRRPSAERCRQSALCGESGGEGSSPDVTATSNPAHVSMIVSATYAFRIMGVYGGRSEAGDEDFTRPIRAPRMKPRTPSCW
jgi:hypothetical protein